MWGFGTIVNGLSELLQVDYAVTPGASTSGAALNTSCGNASLILGTLGAVFLTDVGARPGGPGALCVEVTWTTHTEEWFYDDAGVIDVEVNQDGTFVLTGNGQKIAGDVNQ